MCVTYSLIIACTSLFINNIGMGWGDGVVAVAVLLMILTLM
jgi:hypothetical protein